MQDLRYPIELREGAPWRGPIPVVSPTAVWPSRDRVALRAALYTTHGGGFDCSYELSRRNGRWDVEDPDGPQLCSPGG